MPGYFAQTAVRALVAVQIDLRAGNARDHDHIALAVDLLGDPFGPAGAEVELADIDLDGRRGGDPIVEAHHQDAARGGLMDDAVQRGGGGGIDDDGVHALGDQVGDLLRLLADIVAGIEDAAFDLGGEGLHQQGGFEDIFHLQAPFIADIGVRQRDLEFLSPVSARKPRGMPRIVIPAAAPNPIVCSKARRVAWWVIWFVS